jgi:AhpD family alkylhydroperoxidase
MEQFKHLDSKTIELAGIAASIAGGCKPCLDYHFKKALEVGCSAGEAE